MINLLPKREKRKIQKIYQKRVFLVGLLFVFLSVVFGIIIMLPSYFLLGNQDLILDIQAKNLEEEKAVLTEGELNPVISEVAKQLEIFNKNGYQNVSIVDSVVSTLLEKQVENVGIFQVTYQVINQKSFIQVAGIAESRSDLLEFLRSLRSVDWYKKVDVPIQSFAKRETLDFVIEVEIDPKKLPIKNKSDEE